MKKLTFLFSLLVLIVFHANAQNEKSFSFYAGMHLANEFELLYLGYDEPVVENIFGTGFQLGSKYTIVFRKGFFISPQLEYQHIILNDVYNKTFSGNMHAVNLGILGGYRFFKKQPNFNMEVGFGLNVSNLKIPYHEIEVDFITEDGTYISKFKSEIASEVRIVPLNLDMHFALNDQTSLLTNYKLEVHSVAAGFESVAFHNFNVGISRILNK